MRRRRRRGGHLARQRHLARAAICISMPPSLAVVSAHALGCRHQPPEFLCTFRPKRLLTHAVSFPPVLTAGEDGGRANQEEIRKETQDPPSVCNSTFGALGVQPQGPQPVRFPQFGRRTVLTGNVTDVVWFQDSCDWILMVE